MPENEIDASVANEELVEADVDTEAEAADEPSAADLAARLKRAEAKIERMKLDNKVEKKAEKLIEQSKTGELDETQLDYLDLKGISDEAEIDIIQKVMQKTGQTVRQVLKDEYVQDKLAKLRADNDVKAATPSANKRGGAGAPDSVALALAKFERTGELPEDFATRSAVINAKVEKENTNKPSWR